MDRINTLNRAIDLFGAGKHGWKNRNIGLGVEPTEFNADWCNAVQEELLNVLEAGGQVPAIATRNQLLLALRAAGVFTTPTQFDNTTKAATTGFVKAQGLQGSGLTTVAVTSTLTAAVVGGTVLIASASATTQTLPAANSVPAGTRIEFMNTSTGVGTVQRAGADTLVVNNTSVNSLALGVGDTLTLASNGVNGWLAVAGSVPLRYASALGSSLAASGWKRIPDQNSPTGYIIEQWANGSNQAAAGNQTITLPISFPTVALSVVVSSLYAVATQTGGYALLSSSLSSIVVARNSLDNAAGVTPTVWALGY